jgi:hypothetical protein
MSATNHDGPSFLTPELAAQVDDKTLDRHVVQKACCREAEAAGQSWDGRCILHKGTPAQRAEERRWQRHAAAVALAQQLGHQGDMVPVLTEAEAAQRDSYRGPPPPIDRVHLELL